MRREAGFPWRFMALTYGFSWVLWFLAAGQSGDLFAPPKVVFYILGAFGPSVAALALTYREDGKAGLGKMLQRAIQFRLGIWYMPIFLLIPMIFALALLLDLWAGAPIPDLSIWTRPWEIGGTFLFLFFLGGSCQEEFGWRGYALDRIQARFNAFNSSLILGVLWALWHLPLFFIQGTSQTYMPFSIFALMVISMSFLFTWVHNNTGGSILAALFLHTVGNLSYALFPLMELEPQGRLVGFSIASILMGLVAAGVLLVWGPSRLVRSRRPLVGVVK